MWEGEPHGLDPHSAHRAAGVRACDGPRPLSGAQHQAINVETDERGCPKAWCSGAAGTDVLSRLLGSARGPRFQPGAQAAGTAGGRALGSFPATLTPHKWLLQGVAGRPGVLKIRPGKRPRGAASLPGQAERVQQASRSGAADWILGRWGVGAGRPGEWGGENGPRESLSRKNRACL